MFESPSVTTLESSSSGRVDFTAKTALTPGLRSGPDSTQGLGAVSTSTQALRAVPDSTNNGSGYRTNVDWRPNSSSRSESKNPSDSNNSVVQSSQATVSLGIVDSSKSRFQNDVSASL